MSVETFFQVFSMFHFKKFHFGPGMQENVEFETSLSIKRTMALASPFFSEATNKRASGLLWLCASLGLLSQPGNKLSHLVVLKFCTVRYKQTVKYL